MSEQIVLGINGFSTRVHDASASVVKNGELLAMSEEERFIRQKHAFGKPPHHAIASSLETAGITLDDVDVVAVGWDFTTVFSNIHKQGPTKEQLLNLYFPPERFTYSKVPEIEMVPHHLAHASSAYYLSGSESSLALVVDGQGESQATSIFDGNKDELRLEQEFPITDSLGYFYEAVSEYVGLSRLDAGKTMGLASYGNPVYSFDLLRETEEGYKVDIASPVQKEMDLQQEVTGEWVAYLERVFGEKNIPQIVFDGTTSRFKKQTEFPQKFKDIAASAQDTLNQTVIRLLKMHSNANTVDISIAGGVGLNCTMNGVLEQQDFISDVFIPPFANDAGVSVGAALYLSDTKPTKRLDSAALGPEYSNEVIGETLKKFGIKYSSEDDIAKKVALLLSHGKTVGWFQGRMEAGPRALGNRSILGDPRQTSMHTKLNQIKRRENWRPLAPSILAEKTGQLMTSGKESPFMLKAYQALPIAAEIMPAAVHVDQSSRVQTVSERVNPLYYRMIKEFESLTGVPAVMNTSFNLDDEPIVCTPTDAVRTFFSSGIDHLAIGDYFVSK